MQSWTRKIRRLFFLLIFVGVASTVGCASCEDGDGGISQGSSGSLSVQPLSVNFSQIPLGETDREQVTITNAHTDDALRILDIKLRARENSTIENLQLVEVPSGDFELAAGESRIIEVEHTARGQANAGIIEIYSTDPNFRGDRPYEVDVTTIPNSPRLAADPSAVRFPRLPPGDSDEETLTIRNEGTAPLIIHEASYSGGSDFQVDDIVDETDDEIVLDPYDGSLADANPERFELVIPVQYRPQEEGGDSGEIIIVSNDTGGQTNDDGQGVHIIDVQANADAPCILVDGRIRSFGQVPIGAVVSEVVRVTNCGSRTLEIEGVDLSENSDDDEFALNLGSWDANGDDQVDSAVRLDPGEADTFQIDYGPTEVGSDSGEVIVRSNAQGQQELELELVGRGSDGECPEAKVTAKVRGQNTSPRSTITAAPLDYIILDGSTSDDPDGRVVDYEWEPLQAPDDSTINLSETVEAPGDTSRREFRALTAGTYKVGLTAVDNEGFKSCNQAVATIVATPNEKVHIELTWSNPQDPDESDDTGSDVDLHLAKMGPGKWFESPYDIFFRNKESFWEPETPSLDIDDTNGAGPENIQMDDPSNCEWYAVGVHYYSQRYGTAYATLRIYINENLVFEEINKPLQRGNQFWDVARIHWNLGQATILSVGNVMPASPNGQEPEVTTDMMETDTNGDPIYCSSQGLY